MSLSDFAADGFSAMAAVAGIALTYKAQTVTGVIDIGQDIALPYDGAPGPDFTARIFLRASDLTTPPKVGDTLTSAAKRYRVAAVRRMDGDPILSLDCNDTAL